MMKRTIEVISGVLLSVMLLSFLVLFLCAIGYATDCLLLHMVSNHQYIRSLADILIYAGIGATIVLTAATVSAFIFYITMGDTP